MLDQNKCANTLPQNLVWKTIKKSNITFEKRYFNNNCLNTNFRSLARGSLIHQMLMCQLWEAHQESYSEAGDLTGNILILYVVSQPSKQILVVGGVNHKILLKCINLM